MKNLPTHRPGRASITHIARLAHHRPLAAERSANIGSAQTAIAHLQEALERPEATDSIAAAAANLPRPDFRTHALTSVVGSTYEVVATNSPTMAQKEVDLSLITGSAQSLRFTSEKTKISFFRAKTIEWSDGLLEGQPARVGLVSELRLHDRWMQTQACHLTVGAHDRQQPPELYELAAPGQAQMPPERVEVIYFDGHHLVSSWNGFLTVAQKSSAPTSPTLHSSLAYAAFLLGQWQISGMGWQGSARGEPKLGGSWLALDIRMTHRAAGLYHAHCLIGQCGDQPICHKYFAGGATFAGVLQADAPDGSLCWVGPRSIPGEKPVQQRTTYVRQHTDAMQILGEIQQPDGAWVTIANLRAVRA